MSQELSCPKCTTAKAAETTTVFFEHGEYNGSFYDVEGYADVLRCLACGFQFADLSGYVLDEVRDEDEEDVILTAA